MGGRGSSFEESNEKPLGGNSNGSGEDPITVQPFDINPKDFRATVGEKGKPLDIKTAIAGANPFYRGGAEGNFTENCQRAVIAYELRRRGFDVMALPTFKNDELPGGNRWTGAFMHGKLVKVGASTPMATQNNLEKEMKAWGKGSRAIVSIPGHVFNAENVNGVIRYVDAQTNTVYNSHNVFSRLGKDARYVEIMRTDNLRISERARKSVTPVTDITK